MHGYSQEYPPHSVICQEGDPSSDLYYLQSGKLLICTITGTEVKAIARIGPGEFVGELSFFDGKARSSYVVTLEKSVVIQIPKQEISVNLPPWYTEIGKNLTKKIRLLDGVVQSSHLRKFGTEESQQPLTIEEQRLFYDVLVNQQN